MVMPHVAGHAGRMRRAAVLCAVALAAACKPDLNDTVSIVTEPLLLAVQSSPAEAPVRTDVKYTALVVGPDGVLGAAPIQWNYCNYRNPLSNLGPVAVECSEPGNASLKFLGDGVGASGAIPDLACTNFGPNPPAATAGMPAGRPVDPDTTGGYYQPVSVFLEQPGGARPQTVIYDMRLSCGFSGANQDAQGALTARYHLNQNPSVASLSAGGTTLAPDGGGKTNPVAAGAKLTFEVAWPSCPVTDTCGDGVCGADESAMLCPGDCKVPHGCAGAERYVNFDLGAQSVVDAREGIQVSWFATAGIFDADSTGRQSSDTALTSDNGWKAPSTPGTVHLWVVLHDDRGGVGWGSYTLAVR